MPSFQKKGTTEYIPAWLEPNTYSDDTVRQKLGEYKYLISRQGMGYTYTFATWDNANGTYNRVPYSVDSDLSAPAHNAWIKASFDARYAAGEIWHMFAHPSALTWLPGSPEIEVLDYVSGKKDIWYVGFGALYMYHYIQERGLVNLGPIVTIPGDANGDGVVDALDITIVEIIIAGFASPTPGADANLDGKVNALDITKTERLIAGLPD